MYYKPVCSQPSSPSRGQCTGLLLLILCYETSSLMRPNKLGLDEPKLPPHHHTHTHTHTHTRTHHLSIFFLSSLFPSLLCVQSFVRDYEFALFMTRVLFISRTEACTRPTNIHANNLHCVCVDEGSKSVRSPFTGLLLGPGLFYRRTW